MFKTAAAEWVFFLIQKSDHQNMSSAQTSPILPILLRGKAYITKPLYVQNACCFYDLIFFSFHICSSHYVSPMLFLELCPLPCTFRLVLPLVWIFFFYQIALWLFPFTLQILSSSGEIPHCLIQNYEWLPYTYIHTCLLMFLHLSDTGLD